MIKALAYAKSALHRVVWCCTFCAGALFGRLLCMIHRHDDEVTAGSLVGDYCQLTCKRCGSRLELEIRRRNR